MKTFEALLLGVAAYALFSSMKNKKQDEASLIVGEELPYTEPQTPARQQMDIIEEKQEIQQQYQKPIVQKSSPQVSSEPVKTTVVLQRSGSSGSSRKITIKPRVTTDYTTGEHKLVSNYGSTKLSEGFYQKMVSSGLV